ncbi:Na+:solute symporter [Lysobacter sp. TY2-98]|uniref:Na+:solute symporter n=1 Tax=Lysobacter sp. TY2-98 TaxID=2290922 RepID=UPI000E1FEAC9|nr:Na+:solute symporter [Lysobacter sp. TY2-98]AXK72183.1 Na+:solute symporter [Lysobacter sp. TY2-98]
MQLGRRSAVLAGVAAIGGVTALQAFNSFTCYDATLGQFLSGWAFFVLIPLIPAFVSLMTANPLRAVGACALFAPWLAFAYYTDCVRPYTGGGASMIYVGVLLWGTPSAILGALVTGPVLRLFRISVVAR